MPCDIAADNGVERLLTALSQGIAGTEGMAGTGTGVIGGA
jgi:hypothetical protein